MDEHSHSVAGYTSAYPPGTSAHPLRPITQPHLSSEGPRPSATYSHPFARIVEARPPPEIDEHPYSTARYTPAYSQGTSAHPLRPAPQPHLSSEGPRPSPTYSHPFARIVEARPPSDDPDALYFHDPPPPYEHPPRYESPSRFPVSQSAGEMPAQPTTQPRLNIRSSRKLKNPLKPVHRTAIERMVSLALDILEHESSVRALVYIGVTAVEDWGKNGPGISPRKIIYPTEQTLDRRYTYKRPGNEEMGKWVGFFLRAIRHSFPPIKVKDLNRKRYGYFKRYDWVAGAKVRCVSKGKTPSNENVMLHWEAEDAGVMRLDYGPIASMARVMALHPQGANSDGRRRDAANYRALLVDGALTIAHELVHCFVGLLSGNQIFTPQSLKPPGFGDPNAKEGEAGRTWELRVLGGYARLSHVLERGEQIPRAQVRLDKSIMEIEVDPEAVRAMVERNFEFPLKTIGKWE
ncbi:hypothetical protein C8A03DRAFT_19478, partial [Achaetomium macrosporum]